MFLSAYSSLSSYEAYEALTDKTKLNKRKYQETSRLHDKNLEAAKYCRTVFLCPAVTSSVGIPISCHHT